MEQETCNEMSSEMFFIQQNADHQDFKMNINVLPDVIKGAKN